MKKRMRKIKVRAAGRKAKKDNGVPIVVISKPENPQSVNRKSVQLLKKVVALLLIIVLNWSGILTIGQVWAAFNDTEDSASNLSAASLDFILESGPWKPEERANNLRPGDEVERSINVVNQGFLDFQYRIEAILTGGDVAFCQALKLKAEQDGEIKYADGLTGLVIEPPVVIGSDGQDDWLFTVGLPSDFSGEFLGKFCQFKFVFSGWQTNFATFLGFFDAEEVDNFLGSGGAVKLVVNEVYYDVAESQHCREEKAEWVELYNPTDEIVDLKDWQLCHGQGNEATCNNINSNTEILAHSFAAVGHDNSTWIHCFSVPEGIPTIHQLGGSWPMLGNDGDYIILKNPTGVEVDCASWGNNNTCQFPDGPVVDVAEGHSIARIIAGQDTDTASDWQDLFPSDPGSGVAAPLNSQSSGFQGESESPEALADELGIMNLELGAGENNESGDNDQQLISSGFVVPIIETFVEEINLKELDLELNLEESAGKLLEEESNQEEQVQEPAEDHPWETFVEEINLSELLSETQNSQDSSDEPQEPALLVETPAALPSSNNNEILTPRPLLDSGGSE